ncbi:hypothetical protein [Paenibacillus sp. GXUN7292]|uniref:hypothetical protein n=1 Tax=Paenibacillus sp. GXUN7292 TaxID=3422499 RepID=UPI003D7DB55E
MPVLKAELHTLPIGGDAAVKKVTPPLQGNIVKTIHDGNAIIHIADDCVAKTPEEIDKVLEDYHAAGWRIIESLEAEKEGG